MTTTTTVPATAASVYQQLRGHLTDPKLADAADTLPKVLDQAQAEGWTLTHALEQLLRIEVTATDARRLADRFRFANLPTGQTLDDFDHDHASGIDKALLTELATCRYLDTATNVLLIGPPGVGKTRDRSRPRRSHRRLPGLLHLRRRPRRPLPPRRDRGQVVNDDAVLPARPC